MNFAEVVKFKNEVKPEDGKAIKKVLISTDYFKLIAIAVGKGGELAPHPAPADALITVLKGKAVITYDGKDFKLEEGDFFYMEKGVIHSVRTEDKIEMTVSFAI